METVNKIDNLIQYFTDTFEHLTEFSVPLYIETFGFWTREEYMEDIISEVMEDTKFVLQVRVSPQKYSLMTSATEKNLFDSIIGITKHMDDERVLNTRVQKNETEISDRKLVSIDIFFELNFDLLKEYIKTNPDDHIWNRVSR